MPARVGFLFKTHEDGAIRHAGERFLIRVVPAKAGTHTPQRS
jgi:hypothetical protein